ARATDTLNPSVINASVVITVLTNRIRRPLSECMAVLLEGVVMRRLDRRSGRESQGKNVSRSVWEITPPLSIPNLDQLSFAIRVRNWESHRCSCRERVQPALDRIRSFPT